MARISEIQFHHIFERNVGMGAVGNDGAHQGEIAAKAQVVKQRIGGARLGGRIAIA